MGGCCCCLKACCAKQKRSKYGNLNQFPQDASLTRLLMEDDDSAEISGGGGESKVRVAGECSFVTEEERELIKNKDYQQLRSLQRQQDVESNAQLALQEGSVSKEEEVRFEKERLLFGVEISLQDDPDTYSPSLQHPASSASLPSAAKGRGASHTQGAAPPPTSVQLHAVSNPGNAQSRPTATATAAPAKSTSLPPNQAPAIHQPNSIQSLNTRDQTVAPKGDSNSNHVTTKESGGGEAGVWGGLCASGGGGSTVQHQSEQSDEERNLNNDEDDEDDDDFGWSGDFVCAPATTQSPTGTATRQVSVIDSGSKLTIDDSSPPPSSQQNILQNT